MLTMPPWNAHEACLPTYVGTSRQPWASTVDTHEDVRLGWEQALFTPPTYTPTLRYGDASHDAIVVVEGAVQASKPEPAKMPGADMAEEFAG